MARTAEFCVKVATRQVEVDQGQSLLSVLRDALKPTGCDYGDAGPLNELRRRMQQMQPPPLLSTSTLRRVTMALFRFRKVSASRGFCRR